MTANSRTSSLVVAALACAVPRRLRLAARADTSAASERLVERARLAATVDRDLAEACRAEAAARIAIGERASALLRRHGHRRLGFVRLSDYARERLGISARAVEDAVHVATRLPSVPNVAAAFRAGRLSWTKLRCLVDVAAGNERAWLDYALGHTAAEVVAAADARRTPSDRDRAANATDGSIDGEPAARLRLARPSRLRSLWRRALDMASRVAGRPLGDWEAAELVAAEACAARPAGASFGDRVLAMLVRAARRRRRPFAANTASSGEPSAAGPENDTSGTPTPDGTQAPLGTSSGDHRHIDDIAPAELDRRLREAVQALRTIEPRIGRLLRVLVDHHLYRVLGYRSLDGYARERLGISLRKVWALVKIERGVRRAAPFADAYERGAVSWVRVLTLLPVVDRSNAEAWITRASAVTVRRLVDEVSFVLDRRDCHGPEAPSEPLPLDCRLLSLVAQAQRSRRGSAPPAELWHSLQISAAADLVGRWAENVTTTPEVVDADIRFVGPATVIALFRDALDLFTADGAPRWRALERMLRRVIADWEAEPRHRDPIFARDGWRCTVPACSGRRNLHDHHVRFRSRGGGNHGTNRTTVCAAHHLHGIHTGLIRVTGSAPTELRWDLPLFSCIGDRYV